MGMSTGGLLAPLVALSLTRLGWRWTAVASGLLVLAIGVPLAQIVRHRPEAYGLRPDGDFAGAATTRLVEAGSFTARQALATRAFWFISLGHGAALLVVSAVMVHMVIHVTERLGYSLHQAGVVVALLTDMQATGQRSEEHTSELQSPCNLVCRLLLEKKKKKNK